MAIAAATIAPIKYEALNNEVRYGRSLGYPSSPIRAEPEMIQKTIPTPSNIRAMMYMATGRIVRNHAIVRLVVITYDAEQNLAEVRREP
jgi:hypothetical protein